MAYPLNTEADFWRKVRKTSGCWYWTGATATSRMGRGKAPLLYGRFCWGNEGTIGSHRLAFEFAYGPIPKGLMVLHTCDNSLCVRPSHLVLGTQLDNMRHRKERGRLIPARGEDNAASKLTEDDARKIRKLLGLVSQEHIGRLFGVSQGTVSRIKRGACWGWLGD